MLNKPIVFLLVGFLLGSIPLLTVTFAEEESLIPSWIKSTAQFWIDGGVSDTEFLSALQFLIKEGVLVVPEPEPNTIVTIPEQQNEKVEELTTVINKRVNGQEALDFMIELAEMDFDLVLSLINERGFKDPSDSSFLLGIISDGSWDGVISDGTSMVSVDGTTHALIPFKCQDVGIKIYNVNIQKMTEDGQLMLYIIKNNLIIDFASTESQFGLVMLSGDCTNPPNFQ